MFINFFTLYLSFVFSGQSSENPLKIFKSFSKEQPVINNRTA